MNERSEHLEKLIGRARKRDFWDDLPAHVTPPEPVETRSVRRDAFDKGAWDEMLGQIPPLRRQVEKLAEDHPTSRAANEDLFNLLNQGDPRFHGEAEMKPDHRAQRAMMQNLSREEDMEWIRQETKYDEYNTALAMLTMEDRMRDAMDRVKDAQELAQALEEALQQAIAQAQEAQAAAGAGDGSGVDSAIESLESAMQAAADQEDANTEAGESAAHLLAGAAKQARDELEAEADLIKSYGLDKGQLERKSFDERRQLMQRLRNGRMERLAKLFGAWRPLADAESRRKIKHAPAEVVDVVHGNDLSRMLGTEYANLAAPDLEPLFWLRFAKRQLMQYETRGVDKAGQGPIILLCDESGSMSSRIDAEGNTCEMWSKAVAMALCDQAKRGKRDFIYIGFASAGEQWEVKFDGGKTSELSDVIDFVTHFFNGGTNYERPLSRAMEIIDDYYGKHSKGRPDVVLVTDGICRVTEQFADEWQSVRERADVTCWGIQIGESAGYTGQLESLVDRLVNITHLNSQPEGLVDMFRTV